jgi:4-amino-4-deoxy-L-arabinose transferase-like glycosyltransferase
MINPLFKFLSKNYNNLILILILVVASFYRLYRIMDYMTFLGDEGRDVLVAYQILHGNLTLLGPTASVGGFFLGPIYYYFMAPFLWLFNYNPVGPAIMVAIFGIATVWLIYKVGTEFFGSLVGLVASGLYAISPLVVTYSRSSWNPNLMPFFSLFALYLTYKAMEKRSIKLLILLGFVFGILMQLHYLSLFLGVIIFAYILLFQLVYFKNNLFLEVSEKYLFIFLGFVVGWSPFLAFEIRHKFLNSISIFNFIFHSGDTGGGNHLIVIISDVFFRVFGRLVANFPVLGNVNTWSKLGVDFWSFFALVLGLAGSFFLIYKCFKEYRSHSLDFAKYSLIVLWLVIGVGLFGFYKKSIYDYYFGFMFPLPFLIVGVLLKNIWTNRMGKILSILIFFSLVLLNSLTPPFAAPANRQLAQIEEISGVVAEKTEDKAYNFALIAGGNSDYAYRYFFTLWHKEPTTIQPTYLDPQRKTVADQLLVVCEVPDCRPLGYSLWEIAGFGRAEIAGDWDVSVVKVFRLEHYREK